LKVLNAKVNRVGVALFSREEREVRLALCQETEKSNSANPIKEEVLKSELRGKRTKREILPRAGGERRRKGRDS